MEIDNEESRRKDSDEDRYLFKIRKKICNNDCIYIQPNKTFLYDFKAGQSKAALSKFKRDLNEKSSEFRFLPEKHIIKKFNESVYELNYKGNFWKFATLKDYEENRYELSVYLSKMIAIMIKTDNKIENTSINEMMNFFKGKNILIYTNLWEKAVLILILKNEIEKLKQLLGRTITEIEKVEIYNKVKINNRIKGNKDLINRIKENLGKKMCISLLTAFALKPSIVDNYINNKSNDRDILEKFDYLKLNKDKIYNKIKKYRKANLLRHNYIPHFLINYTKLYKYGLKNNKNNEDNNNPIDYTDINLIQELKENENHKKPLLKIEKRLAKFSPKTIKLYELCWYVLLKNILNYNEEVNNDDEGLFTNLGNYFKEVVEEWEKFDVPSKNIEKCKDKISINNQNDDFSGGKIDYISISNTKSIIKLDIALANIQFKESNWKKSIEQNPNLSINRYQELSHILNLVEKEEAGLFVMPEYSVPYNWIPMLLGYSKNHKRNLIFGGEILRFNDIAYNFVFNILPIEINNINDAFLIPRIKNHYAPEEVRMIKELRYKVPPNNLNVYDLIHFNGYYYTIFYCYELANITHRSQFKSKIDFLVTTENNKDVNYFSNIVGSCSRDLHCYFVQCNSSQYGDSRITQPSKTHKKNKLKIKGGKNHTILVESINISDIRDFQKRLNLYRNQDDDRYKPTPPDYNIDFVYKRINNEDIFNNG
jgi:hypothetical protein